MILFLVDVSGVGGGRSFSGIVVDDCSDIGLIGVQRG